MRVVIDTNVLLSALISPFGNPAAIYQSWRAGRFDLVTSTAQLDELRRASRYPKLKALLPPHLVGTMINNLNRAVVIEKLPALHDAITLNDPDDAFLLAMAVAGEADYLITGDHRAGLVQLGNIDRTRILIPARFCEEVL
jgi:putative PIN family toxin of toxin-antitoxin system